MIDERHDGQPTDDPSDKRLLTIEEIMSALKANLTTNVHHDRVRRGNWGKGGTSG